MPLRLSQKRLLWRRVSAPAPPRPERKPWQRNSEVGLTTEDEQWMTYWRLPPRGTAEAGNRGRHMIKSRILADSIHSNQPLTDAGASQCRTMNQNSPDESA